MLIVFTALAVIRLAESTARISCTKILETLIPLKQIIIEDKSTKTQISKFVQPSEDTKPLLKLAKINWVT